MINIKNSINNLVKKESEIERYCNIINSFLEINVSEDEKFQKTYDYFYKLRRGAEWRRVYFGIFESLKNKDDVSFAMILNELYKQTGRVEASFASKMLATINTSMPIWDSRVLNRVGIVPSSKRGIEKIKDTIEKYNKLINWYTTLLEDVDESSKYINAFDERFPQYSLISSVKKIDFILWAMDDDITDIRISNAPLGLTNYDSSMPDINPTDVLEKFSGLTKAISTIAERIAPIIDFQKTFEESLIPTFEKIRQIFAGVQFKIPKIEIPEELLKSLGNISYLHLLSEIKWPLFLEGDEYLRARINELCNCENKNYPLDELAEEICDYYSNEKLEKMLDGWRRLDLTASRIVLLEEAIDLHNNELYYGSTALLMCQIQGIITDISEYAKMNDLSVDEEDERILCEKFKVTYENHLKGLKNQREKHMMLRLMLYPKSGFFYWQSITNYIYNVVLTSDDNLFREHNPMRNKICHGIHTDFGTKEKSLKSILVTDLLLNLYADLNWMISNQDGEE